MPAINNRGHKRRKPATSKSAPGRRKTAFRRDADGVVRDAREVNREDRRKRLDRDEWRSDAERYYRHRAWHRLRSDVFASYGVHCSVCGSLPTEGDHHVDHVIPHRGDPVLFFNLTNLWILCRSCHTRKSAIERSVTSWAEALTKSGDKAQWLAALRDRLHRAGGVVLAVVSVPEMIRLTDCTAAEVPLKFRNEAGDDPRFL